MRLSHGRGLTLVLALTGSVYLAILPVFLERLNPLTGDEPFYVMTAISLLRDRDLDESNNYAQRDYDEFYPSARLPAGWRGWPAFPRILPPHGAMTELPGVHTKHGIGLSLLIAVPYEVFGRLGAVLVLILAGVLLAGQMYLLGRTSGASPSLAAAVATGLAITMPIAPYALLIFPEVPAALLLLYAVRRLAARENTTIQWVAAGASIGFLPWLHQRFGPTAVVLAAVLLFRVWRSRARLKPATGVAPVAVGGFTLIGYNLWLYGSPVQNSADHAGFHDLSGAINGLFGLAIDAQWGLFVAAPVYLLALVCIPFWTRAARTVVLIAAVAALPYLVVVAAYSVWWGEWGPPARYLVPLAPLAAGPLSAWLSHADVLGRAATAALWLIGASLAAIGVANPQRFYHHPDGRNNLVSRLDELLQTNLATHLPAFQPYALSSANERIGAGLALLAVTGVTALLVYIIPVLLIGLVPRVRAADAR